MPHEPRPTPHEHWAVTPPSQEVVRFRGWPAHSFPTGPVVDVRPPRTEGTPEEMTTSFLALTGPQGALPQHYTAIMIQRIRAKDYSLRDFFDIFNHRACRCSIGPGRSIASPSPTKSTSGFPA